jgi:general secretion pathway protein D
MRLLRCTLIVLLSLISVTVLFAQSPAPGPAPQPATPPAAQPSNIPVAKPDSATRPASSSDRAESIKIRGMTTITLKWLLHAVAQVEGYRFMVSQKVYDGKQDVTIISPTPTDPKSDVSLEIPVKSLFGLLLAVLKTYRLILSPFGDENDPSLRFYEVIDVAQALQSASADDVIELGRDSSLTDFKTNASGFVTLIAPMKYADATVVRTALQSFGVREGALTTITGINALLIADYASNVRRFAKIINLMDKPTEAPRLEILPVENLDAEELAGTIDGLIQDRNTLSQGGSRQQPGGSGRMDDQEKVTIEVPANINALMVQGYEKGINLVKELIKKLDIKVPGSDNVQGRIHVYRARNVQAAELADALNNILRDGNVSFSASSDRVPGPDGKVPVPLPASSRSTLSEQLPVIESYENTNSLLIIARPSVFSEIRKLIDLLDQRRPQVMIEAAILEVRRDDDFSFGVELASIDGAGSGLRINAGTSFGFSDIVDSTGVPISTGGGTPAGRSPIFGTGGIFTLTKGGPFDIPFLVRFLKQQTDVNILSVPRVLANDNEEAEIDINTEIPTSSLNTLNNNNSQITSGQYETDGITLTVTPQITEDNYVVLTIDLDVSAFIGQPAQPGLAPPRTRRTIKTNITVPDEQTIVIGGLTSNTASRSVSKIPFLGDIPVLGEFFKSETTQDRQTNLYIFVRPSIYRDRDFSDLVGTSTDMLGDAHGHILKTHTGERYFSDALEGNRRAQASTKPGSTGRRIVVDELPAAN